MRESGKYLVLSVNLDRSDLAFRTAFPIMVSNALGWFAGTSGELRESVGTGQVVSFSTDSLVDDATLRLDSPSSIETALSYAQRERNDADDQDANSDESESQTTTADERESEISLGPFNECGIWTLNEVNAGDPKSVTSIASFAVNLANARETDLRPPSELLSESKTEVTSAHWFARPFWYYLVAAASVLLVVEWFLYQRRVLS